MTNPARLQRRPFLTPLWLFALTVMAAAAVLMFAAWLLVTGDSTTIIVVRHAEKVQGDGADPPLSPAGQARAELLARMFGDARLPGHIDAIYVSPTLRNRLTAAPLAQRLGLTPTVAADAPRALARRVLQEHPGGRILVVGHLDTMPAVVAALSGAKNIPPIGAEEYGTMYIVTVPRIGQANVLRLNY
ncbi:MAG: SixA phosphatase family protein [Steroidobacteraceae bacterium]